MEETLCAGASVTPIAQEWITLCPGLQLCDTLGISVQPANTPNCTVTCGGTAVIANGACTGATPAPGATLAPLPTTTTSPGSGFGSIGVRGWLLIGLAVCCLTPVLLMCCFGKAVFETETLA